MRRLFLLFGMVVALATGGEAAAKGCSLRPILNLPVTIEKYRALAPAKINGVDAMFTVDSGAFYSTIATSRAKQLNLSTYPLPNGMRISGVAGLAEASATKVRDFTLADLPLHYMEFVVSAADGAEAGLLGQNVLGLKDIEYDFSHGAVRLFETEGCDRSNLAYWTKSDGVSVIDIEPPREHSHMTYGHVYLNGVKLKALFDTGAGASMVTKEAAARAGVKMDAPGVVEVGRTSGLGAQTLRTWLAPIASFKIGDEEVRNIKLFVSENVFRRGDWQDSDMLVGFDFFISHRVFVANNEYRMFLTYEGGPIFNTSPKSLVRDEASGAEKPQEAKLSAEPEPTDADGYGRRGAARMGRRELEGALSDFDKAVSMAPADIKYLKLRSELYQRQNKPFLAIADLNAAVKLQPGDVAARIMRAELRLGERDNDGALSDLAAASAAAAKPDDQRLRLAAIYLRLDKANLALPELNQFISTHPDYATLASAIADRCWARALLNVELDAATGDCNRAVDLSPKSAFARMARGYVRLRRGLFAKAAEDEAAALVLKPEEFRARYGLGLARRAVGKTEEGDADLQQALAAHPQWKAVAQAYGLEPQTSAPAPR